MWEMQHNEKFWDIVPQLHSAIDRESLFDYLLYEFSDMDCIDSNSGAFRNHVRNFFEVHKWNIDKLADTLVLTYLTLENVRYHKHNKYDEVKDFVEYIDTKGTEDYTKDVDNKGTEDTTINHDMTWDEKGKEDEEDVNFVSAFNDQPSPSGNRYIDTEKDRTTKDRTYSKDGKQHDTDVKDKDTTDITKTKYGESTTGDRDTINNMKDTWHEDNDKVGHDGGSYQSLIEEERKQAQFNIYKWIAKHFSRELLVCLW